MPPDTYDPADNSIKCHALAIDEMRKSLTFVRQDGARIELCVIGHNLAEYRVLKPEHALDLGTELIKAGLAALKLKQ